MSSTRVNLIPAQRRLSRARYRRTLGWATGAGAYAALLVAIYLGLAFSGGTQADPAAEIKKLDEQKQQTQGKIDGLNGRLVEARNLQEAGHALHDQPDWSLLLALLSRKADKAIVISELALQEASRAATATNLCPASDHDYLLCIRGRGPSQREVSQFAMRLEQTALFDHVRIRQTSRVSVADQDATAFELECGMIDGKGVGR